MADITLSQAVRSNLLNLQSTAQMMGKTQERLATGLKVNSALDNPTNFFTASSLNSRASDLGQLLDSVSNAVQTIAAADKGLTAITKLVETAQATARQALQAAATLGSTPATLASTSSSDTTSLSITASVSASAATSASGNLTSLSISDGSAAAGGSSASGNLTALSISDGSAEVLATTETGDLSGLNATGGTITINGQNVVLDAADGSAEALTALQDAATAAGTFTVTDNLDGTFAITATTGEDLVIGGDATTLTELGLSAGTTANQPAVTDTSGSITVNGSNIAIDDGDDLAAVLGKLQTAATASSGANQFSVSETGGVITLTGANGNDLTIGGDANSLTALGLTAGTDAGSPAVTDTSGSITVNGSSIAIEDGDDLAAVLGKLQTAATASSGANQFSVSETGGVITLTGANGNDLTIGGDANALTALGLTAGTEEAVAAVTGNAGTVTVNGQNIALADGDDAAAILGKFQTAAAASSGANAFTVSNNSGVLTITGTAGNDVTVGGDAGSLTALGLTAGTTDGTPATSAGPNPKRDELRVQYNELLSQIDQLAKDAGFNGVNLLNGDSLEVLFNEDGSSKLAVTGVTFDAAGLGLGEIASGGFDTNADINGVLNSLKSGIDSLRTQASKFGSNLSVVETRQDFTKNMINVLETGAANLTLADTNEEAANLLALQTRQQLSSTALSLASQADQNVLRLF
jgi:flagellin